MKQKKKSKQEILTQFGLKDTMATAAYEVELIIGVGGSTVVHK